MCEVCEGEMILYFLFFHWDGRSHYQIDLFACVLRKEKKKNKNNNAEAYVLFPHFVNSIESHFPFLTWIFDGQSFSWSENMVETHIMRMEMQANHEII